MSLRHEKLKRALVLLTCVAIIAGIGWAGTSCLRNSEDQPRRMSAAEAGRLAQVRLNNHDAGPVAMTLNLPKAAGGGGLSGQIDWTLPMVNAASTAAGKSQPDGLLQAIPGLIADHDAEAGADPAALPSDGWTVRRLQSAATAEEDPAAATTDIVLSAILALGAPQADDAKTVRAAGTWLKEAAIDGAVVDVFQAPLMLGSTAENTSSDVGSAPEAVFWVDRDAQLRRIQFDPAGSGLATADFLLEQRDVPQPTPIDMLGGKRIDPRDVTEDETQVLSGLRQRNSTTGAKVDIELPVADNEVIRAQGHLDWRTATVYLAVDAPGKENDGLLLVLPGGAATLSTEVDGMPPKSPPVEGWTVQRWEERIDEDKASDLDTLLFRLLVMQAQAPDDPDTVAETAAWLREDTVGKTDTTVYEFPVPGDSDEDSPGQAPFRYWVGEKDQALYRVEMRTQNLGLAHADLTPQEPQPIEVPYGVLMELANP